MDNVIIDGKVESLLDLLEKLRQILKEYNSNEKLKEFLLYAAEKKAEEAVELAVSINQELLKMKSKISSSYYDSFMDLDLFDLFSEKELRELAGTAGFRNRLAHEYLEINPEIAIRAMERILKIYPSYLQKIRKIAGKMQIK